MERMGLSVPVNRLWGGEDFAEWPCLIVEYRDSDACSDRIELPACPVILAGEAPDSVREAVDVAVPDLASARNIRDAILRKPRAASVVVELLRLLPCLDPEQGLVAESLAYGLLQGSAEHAEWLGMRKPPVELPPAGSVRTERKGDDLDLLLDRPWADNAIDQPMRDGLAEALRLAALDTTIVRVRLRGAGRSFSLGAELGEFGTTRDPASAHAIRRQTLPGRWALRCADRLEVHVQGACVGAGLEIAAFARRITASPRAWFQLPELAMGILPGAGGCVSLVRRIGRQRTAELILSGKRLSARAALDWGLVDALVDDISADEGGADIG